MHVTMNFDLGTDQRTLHLNTEDPAARLLLRAWSRQFPDCTDLANIAYPDSTVVIENLREPGAPAQLTRRVDGRTDLRCPKRRLYAYDVDVPLSGAELDEFHDTENEKSRLFDSCYDRIVSAAQPLHLMNLVGVTAEEVEARQEALNCAIRESLQLEAVLGLSFGDSIRKVAREVFDELREALTS